MGEINRIKLVLFEKKRTNKWLAEQMGGNPTTEQMKQRLGIKSGALADRLPTLTIAAKNLATEMTNYNVEQKATKGVFITTSKFTSGAVETANKASKKIVLIDGKSLADYMIEYNVGVSEKKGYEVKKLDSDYFEE